MPQLCDVPLNGRSYTPFLTTEQLLGLSARHEHEKQQTHPVLDSVDIELAKSLPAFFEEQNLMSHGQENVKALKLSKSPLGHKERDKDEAPGIQLTVIGWTARHEVAMNNRPLASGVVLLLLSALQPVDSVGTISELIDSGHSTASLTVGPLAGGRQWNVGIATVSGTMQWNDRDITKSVLDLTIYPAGQGARLLNPDGRLRSYTSAALSRYTVMTFGSDHAELDQSGKLRIYGTLTITHVEWQTDSTWNDAYTGPEYRAPVAHSTAGEVVFSLENPRQGTMLKSAEVSGSTTIERKDFPGLRSAMLEAIWPLVVEDEHCEMPGPKPSLRDYQGAICTGHVIELTPIPRPFQEFGIDYPIREEVAQPAVDRTTIKLRLNFFKVKSADNSGP